ncbi:MAG: hypothetical protein E7370_02560 [Clostridiales bacterium]|nr:hypothetical protein [Clostridiales bacterium]
MKKKSMVFLAMIMLMTCAVSFVGCNESDSGEQKIMNLSLNPEVEFILDADDKVVSVNALNEEGNLIVSAEVFTGKTAEEAAQLFVEISKETGFLISGNAYTDENELTISFSGDTKAAEELYNDVKSKVDEYLTAENISATIEQAALITEEQLEALVAECTPYLESAKIQSMTYNELIQELVESRKETAEFYSQELKNAYYEAKALVMKQIEIQAVKAQVGIDSLTGAAFDYAFDIYVDAVEVVENTRMDMMVKEDSPYQVALNAFREAKAEYLNYRKYVASLEQNEITTLISQKLANLQTAVDGAETALLQAGDSANLALDSVKATLDTTYAAVISLIKDYSAKASQFASEISTKQQEAQTAFFNEFETAYAEAIAAAETKWNEMQIELKNSYVAE